MYKTDLTITGLSRNSFTLCTSACWCETTQGIVFEIDARSRGRDCIATLLGFYSSMFDSSSVGINGSEGLFVDTGASFTAPCRYKRTVCYRSSVISDRMRVTGSLSLIGTITDSRSKHDLVFTDFMFSWKRTLRHARTCAYGQRASKNRTESRQVAAGRGL